MFVSAMTLLFRLLMLQSGIAKIPRDVQAMEADNNGCVSGSEAVNGDAETC